MNRDGIGAKTQGATCMDEYGSLRTIFHNLLSCKALTPITTLITITSPPKEGKTSFPLTPTGFIRFIRPRLEAVEFREKEV